jgi:hypothetical protein
MILKFEAPRGLSGRSDLGPEKFKMGALLENEGQAVQRDAASSKISHLSQTSLLNKLK